MFRRNINPRPPEPAAQFMRQFAQQYPLRQPRILNNQRYEGPYPQGQGKGGKGGKGGWAQHQGNSWNQHYQNWEQHGKGGKQGKQGKGGKGGKQQKGGKGHWG